MRGQEIDLWASIADDRERFDELLAADPTIPVASDVDEDEMELRRILGVA
jgi:hypothetical protein